MIQAGEGVALPGFQIALYHSSNFVFSCPANSHHTWKVIVMLVTSDPLVADDSKNYIDYDF